LRVQDHGGGDDRTRERTAASFVASSHRPNPALERRPLAPEGRTNVLLRKRQARRPYFGRSTHALILRSAGGKSIGETVHVEGGDSSFRQLPLTISGKKEGRRTTSSQH